MIICWVFGENWAMRPTYIKRRAHALQWSDRAITQWFIHMKGFFIRCSSSYCCLVCRLYSLSPPHHHLSCCHQSWVTLKQMEEHKRKEERASFICYLSVSGAYLPALHLYQVWGTDVVCIIIDFKCEEKCRVPPMINLRSLISSAHPHQREPCRESGDRDSLVWSMSFNPITKRNKNLERVSVMMFTFLLSCGFEDYL